MNFRQNAFFSFFGFTRHRARSRMCQSGSWPTKSLLPKRTRIPHLMKSSACFHSEKAIRQAVFSQPSHLEKYPGLPLEFLKASLEAITSSHSTSILPRRQRRTQQCRWRNNLLKLDLSAKPVHFLNSCCSGSSSELIASLSFRPYSCTRLFLLSRNAPSCCKPARVSRSGCCCFL
jgi:hypothetical protein